MEDRLNMLGYIHKMNKYAVTQKNEEVLYVQLRINP